MVRQNFTSEAPFTPDGESINTLWSMFLTSNKTGTSDSTIGVIAYMTKSGVIGPLARMWRWDGETGDYLRTFAGNVFDPVTYPDVMEAFGPTTQSRDGMLWTIDSGGLNVSEVDPETIQETGLTYAATHFEDCAGFSESILIDKEADLAIIPTAAAADSVDVHQLSTGDKLRTINVAGSPSQLVAEDGRRCYIVTTEGLLVLLDYDRNKVFGVYGSPARPSGIFLPTSVKFAYDQKRKRLLTFGPVTVDGGGDITTVIKGYVPIPIITNIITPIPLRPMRKDHSMPVLVKTCGDIGEPLGGQPITATVTGDGELASALVVTDNTGEAVFRVTGTDEGTLDFDVETTIED
jgi:hypothetical protein